MLAQKLNISRREAMGALLDFWIWCQEQTVDGHVDAHVDACETALSLPRGMCAAMSDIKWLSIDAKGFTIPHWDRLLSKGAKARLQKNLRQERWRNNDPKNVDDVVDAHVDGRAPTREEKRREENTNTGGEENPPQFSPLDIQRVLDAYPVKTGRRQAEWQVSRVLVMLRHRLEPDPVAFLLGKLSAYAASDVVKRGKVMSAKNFFEGDHFDAEPATWADHKPESEPPPDKPVFNDATEEEAKAMMDEINHGPNAELFARCKKNATERAARKSQVEPAGTSKGS